VAGAAEFEQTLGMLAHALADRPAALVAVTGASNVSGEDRTSVAATPSR
jgi:hypothetical protein